MECPCKNCVTYPACLISYKQYLIKAKVKENEKSVRAGSVIQISEKCILLDHYFRDLIPVCTGEEIPESNNLWIYVDNPFGKRKLRFLEMHSKGEVVYFY